MFALQPFRPRILSALRGYGRSRFLKDVAAGVTVGIVALPLAMAFGIASGVKPENGLFTAVIAGFVISALGGSSVQIGGPAGAFIVIVYGIIERYGLPNLLIATSLAGVVLFVAGLLRLGGLVRFIPVSIVIGFTNGIAVLIGLSQLKDLMGLKIAKMPGDFFAQIATLVRHLDTFNPVACGMGLIVLLALLGWPRMGRRAQQLDSRGLRVAARMPGPIVMLVLCSAATALLQLPVETIGTRFGGIPQALPALVMPDFDWPVVKQLIFPTLTIAMLGAIESLVCARVADNVAPELPAHDPHQELMAQGLANAVVPFFGGIPATGTIARTITNVRAGGTTPVAGMVHAFALLVVLLLAAPLAANVPLAALAGVLLFVAWNMGEWREFTRLRHFRMTYVSTLMGTFLATVIFDLTVAVELGLMLALGFFVMRMGKLFRVDLQPPDPALPGVQVASLYGALFFGAVGQVEELAERLPEDTRVLVLQGHQLVQLDTTGVDALTALDRQLHRRDARLMLCSLNEQPASLVRRSGLAALLGPGGIQPDLAAARAALLRETGTADSSGPRGRGETLSPDP